jgi:hypothetical protein
MANHFGPRTTLIGAADVTDATTFPCSRTGGKDELPHAELVKTALAGVFGSFRSLRWVFASQIPGFKADFDRTTGLGTDNSAILSGQASVPGTMLVIDADTVFDQIVIGSESVVDGLGLGKIMKRKPRPNSGGPLFVNAHVVAYPTAPIDGRVTIRNLFIDANRRAGGTGNSTTLVTHVNDDSQIVPVIACYGVVRPVIENVHVYDPTSFGVQLSNCTQPFVSNLGAVKAAGDAVQGNAVLQCEGGVFGLRAYGLYGQVNDDPFALNADDGNQLPGYADTRYAGGPIRDAVLMGATFTGGTTICRFLSATAAHDITNVTIDGATNVCTYNGFHFDTFGITGDGSGGWYDDVKIVNCRVTGNVDSAVYFGAAKFGVVTVQNLTAYCTGKLLTVTATASGTRLNVLNPRCYNSTDPAIDVRGAVDLSVVSPHRPAASFVDAGLIDVSAATPGPVAVVGGGIDCIANVVRASVAVPNVLVSGVRQRRSKGGPAVQASVALGRVRVGGLDGQAGYGVTAGADFRGDGTADYARALVVERFKGGAGVTIAGQTPAVGAAWSASSNGNLKQTADGWLYLVTTDEANTAGTQPSTGNFAVRVSVRRLSALASGQQLNVILFGPANFSDYVIYSFDGSGQRILHLATILQSTNVLPAADGTEWEILLVCTSSGSSRTVKSYYSTDDGVTWASLMADATTTQADGPRVALFGSVGGVGGWGPTTGHQFAHFALLE